MDIEKRLAILQYTYAASVAETVNTYDKLKALDTIVERRKERQTQSAPYLNQQLGIESVEDVFYKLSEIYGCANWSVEKTEDGYTATATSCKLCSLSKKMGGANPCHGWCLDPMIAMLSAASKMDAQHITVESTLMIDDQCKVVISTKMEPQ
ncbi:MAG: hypothetical protein VB111_01820 [Clostridiaceae bacterium]|nr:hypothetical protein [Clostridiaceae bacterium]